MQSYFMGNSTCNADPAPKRISGQQATQSCADTKSCKGDEAMSDATQISKVDAIRQVIAEGGPMDYADVVAAVREKHGLSVSSALVERVHLDERQRIKIEPHIRLEVGNAGSPKPDGAEEHVTGKSTSSDLSHAVAFVKAMHGLQNAKKALAELESIVQGTT
jgi:hypothetical protein